MSNEITIKKTEWDKIQRELSKLNALEAGGVDNWEWYGESLAEWHKENDIEELIGDFVENVNDLLVEADVDQPAGPGCGYSISFDEEAMKKFLQKFITDYEDIKKEY